VWARDLGEPCMACGGGRRAGLVPGGHARHAASGQGRAGWGSTCARGGRVASLAWWARDGGRSRPGQGSSPHSADLTFALRGCLAAATRGARRAACLCLLASVDNRSGRTIRGPEWSPGRWRVGVKAGHVDPRERVVEDFDPPRAGPVEARAGCAHGPCPEGDSGVTSGGWSTTWGRA